MTEPLTSGQRRLCHLSEDSRDPKQGLFRTSLLSPPAANEEAKSQGSQKTYLFLLLNQLKKVTSRTVLEDDPQVVSCLIPVEELEDVPVLEVVKDPNLKECIR